MSRQEKAPTRRARSEAFDMDSRLRLWLSGSIDVHMILANTPERQEFEFWLKYFGSIKVADLVVRMLLRTRKHSEIPNQNKPEKVLNISLVAKRAWLQKA